MRSRSVRMGIAAAGLAALAWAQAAHAAGPGPNNAITDVPGIRVGHHSVSPTSGTTVILAATESGGGATGSITQRGGAPSTRETDLLRPENMVTIVNAIVLSGGGPFGLAAASGVMACLEAQSTGFPVGGGNVVPIVPAAVFQEPNSCGGPVGPRPDFEAGLQACQAAAAGPVAQGNVGAGTGAVAGTLKGGIGTASLVLDNGVVVGALVALNSVGSVHDERGVLYAGMEDPDREFNLRRTFKGKTPKVAAAAADAYPGRGTLAVVATNVTLTKAQAIRIAEMADDGLARVIKPIHTPFDGDTVFAVGTGRIALDSLGDPEIVQAQIGDAAAEVLGRAVVNAMLAAQSTDCHDSYCDAYPSACRKQK